MAVEINQVLKMLHYILITLFLLTLRIHATNINEILYKFDEDKCIEDNLDEDWKIFFHTSPGSGSILLTRDGKIPGKSSLSIINELAQLNKIDYFYYLEKEEGSSHKKYFYISLTLGTEVYKGNGQNIKEAKRHAADEALLHTNYVIPEIKEQYEDMILTPTVELNNIAMQLGMKVTYLSEDELIAESLMYKKKNLTIPDDKSFKSHTQRFNYTIYHPYTTKKLDVPKENKKSQTFKVGVVVYNMRFIGVGHSLQAAKHNAAEKALIGLQQISPKELDHCITEGITCNPNNNKSPISLLYEMAQREKHSLDFEVVDETGPAHEKVFITKCQFGDLTAEGVGKSKKISKRSASENMLEKLKHFSPSNDVSTSSTSNTSKKKNKKKVIKNQFEKFAMDAKRFVASTWEYVFPVEEDQGKTDENSDKDNKKKQKYKRDEVIDDYKQILLGLSQKRGITVNFVDLGIENSKYYSLAFIGTSPKQVCLGDGQSYDLSRQKASLEALNFYQKLGIESLIPSEETFKYIKNMDFGKMAMIGSDVVNEENRKKE